MRRLLLSAVAIYHELGPMYLADDYDASIGSISEPAQ